MKQFVLKIIETKIITEQMREKKITICFQKKNLIDRLKFISLILLFGCGESVHFDPNSD